METGRFPVKGMESVVATVTGYHGSERFNLIKLIDAIGASYVGSVYRGVTHLVCQKFEGRKYELAKKFQIKMVNHRWVEECAMKGKRVAEEPYTFLSGEDVGPLFLDIPLEIYLNENKKLKKCKKPVIRIECEDMDDVAWTDKTLLSELDEPSTSGHPHSRRLKKRESASPNHNRKRRKLVKKQLSIENFVSTSKVGQPNRVRNAVLENNDPEIQNSDPDVEILQSVKNRCASDRLFMAEENNNDAHQEVEELENVNDGKQNSYANVGQCSAVNISEEHCETAAENFVNNDSVNKPPASIKMSCVICWTEFSTTRGVLQCGHRFCFSCIQDWAAHMVSKSKPSTCPLCKAVFTQITKVDDPISSDQKIYSQSIPDNCSNMNIHYVSPEAYALSSNPSAQVCCECSSREPEDLLVQCDSCQIRCIHCFCVDPPLFPWTCVLCKDLQMIYYNTR